EVVTREEIVQALREAQSMKLATAREGARSLTAALAVDEPERGIVEGALLDVLYALAEREGLEDAIDIVEDRPRYGIWCDPPSAERGNAGIVQDMRRAPEGP